MGELAIISESTVRQFLTRQLAFDAIRDAFEAVALGHSKVFDVVIGMGLHDGEIFGLKSGTDSKNELVGFKCGSYWAGNADNDLPAHGSTILLLDPATGFPKVLVSASYLNGFRTAAADAVAVSALARPEASVLGVIGAGHQAEHEIRAIAEVRDLTRIKIFTRSDARAEWLTNQLADLDVEFEFTDAETAARESDIVVTVTPSREPLVRADWISPGTHISAMGADAKGKQELDTALLTRSRLFAEYPQQSITLGEFQHGHAEGLIESANAVTALGLVTLGKAPGRTSAEEITVFDSSGIAIQDLAMAGAIFDAASKAGQLESIDF